VDRLAPVQSNRIDDAGAIEVGRELRPLGDDFLRFVSRIARPDRIAGRSGCFGRLPELLDASVGDLG